MSLVSIVGCCLRFSLLVRDVEGLLADRGISANHVTLWRSRPTVRPGTGAARAQTAQATNDSWRVDETYVRVKGQ